MTVAELIELLSKQDQSQEVAVYNREYDVWESVNGVSILPDGVVEIC